MMKKFNIGDTVWIYEPFFAEDIYLAEVVAVDEKKKIAVIKTGKIDYDQLRFKYIFKTKNAATKYGIRYEEKCIRDHQRVIDRLRKQFKEA